MTYYSRFKERPCPGCGDVEQRPAQRLCKDCRRQLELGKKREQECKDLETSDEKIRLAISAEFHYGTGGAHLGFLAIKDHDVLRALVRLGGLEKAHWGAYKTARFIHYSGNRPGYYDRAPSQHVWATLEQADDIQLVLDYIKLVIKKAYEDGQVDGRSLIQRLATAGVDEINRMTTGVNK